MKCCFFLKKTTTPVITDILALTEFGMYVCECGNDKDAARNSCELELGPISFLST
jgi:hypothetical protein